jgi:hypothetical protein
LPNGITQPRYQVLSVIGVIATLPFMTPHKFKETLSLPLGFQKVSTTDQVNLTKSKMSGGLQSNHAGINITGEYAGACNSAEAAGDQKEKETGSGSSLDDLPYDFLSCSYSVVLLFMDARTEDAEELSSSDKCVWNVVPRNPREVQQCLMKKG